jgi:hypothetical protein
MRTGNQTRWLALAALAAALGAGVLTARGAASAGTAAVPGAPAKPAAPNADELAAHLKAVTAQTQIIQQMAAVADSHTASSIAAMLAVNDIIKDPQEAIAFYEKALSRTEDPAVQRAECIQLAQLFHQIGEDGKALDMYQKIMITSPFIQK